MESKRFQPRQPLEVGEPSIRQLGAVEMNLLQPRVLVQVGQPSVCDLGALDKKRLQPRQNVQLHKAGIRDLRVVEGKPFQPRQRAQMGEASIRDVGAVKMNVLQPRKPMKVHQRSVRDLSPAERDHFHLVKVAPRQPASKDRLDRRLVYRVYDPSIEGFNGGHGPSLPLGRCDDQCHCHAQRRHDQEQRAQRELGPSPLGRDQLDVPGEEFGHVRQLDGRARGSQCLEARERESASAERLVEKARRGKVTFVRQATVRLDLPAPERPLRRDDPFAPRCFPIIKEHHEMDDHIGNVQQAIDDHVDDHRVKLW